MGHRFKVTNEAPIMQRLLSLQDRAEELDLKLSFFGQGCTLIDLKNERTYKIVEAADQRDVYSFPFDLEFMLTFETG